MDCISLLLLIALGGSCGGVASAIAQNNVNNSYKIRVPFSFDKNTQEARLVALGILGNIIIGAAASISIFFVAGPIFNLEPTNQTTIASSNQKQKVVPIIFDPLVILKLPEKQAIDYAKIFSISVAAGFAGISLMENMAQRVTDITNTTFSGDEQHRANDTVILQEEKENEDGKTKTTAILSSQEEDRKAISLTPTNVIESAQKQVEATDNLANKTPSSEEALNQLPSENSEKGFKASNDKLMVGSSK